MSCYEWELEPEEQALINTMSGEIWTAARRAGRARQSFDLSQMAEAIVLARGLPPDDTLIDELIRRASLLGRIVDAAKKQYLSGQLTDVQTEELGHQTHTPRTLEAVFTLVTLQEIRHGALEHVRDVMHISDEARTRLEAEIPYHRLVDRAREAQARRWNESPLRWDQPI